MVSTFYTPRKLDVEEVNPMSHLLSKALDVYSRNMHASYLPQKLETELALNKAKTNLIGEQAKYYGPNIQSQLALRDIQKQLYSSQASQSEAQARKLQAMLDMISNGSQESSNKDISYQPEASGAQYQNTSFEPLTIGNYNFENPENFQENTPARQISEKIKYSPHGSSWGINIPKPSKEDMRNKLLLDIDSYTPIRNQAIENQNLQQKGYLERSLQTNNQANEANQFNQILDRYNNVMDKTLLSGPIGSKIPIPTSARQEIDSLSNEMRLGGVERLRNAMGNARFSNLDMQVASTLKPDITWTPEARKFYTDFMKATNQRMNEKAQFYRIAGDPRMGVPYNLADSLWSSYQLHHPIVESEKTQKLNDYKKNNWMSYLTQKAIKSIQEKGDYNPKDKGLMPTYSLKELKDEKERRARNKRA